jgi:hypothetical protein
MQPNPIALQLSITVRGITQRGRSSPRLPNSMLKMLPSTAIRLIPRVSNRSKTPKIDKRKEGDRPRPVPHNHKTPSTEVGRSLPNSGPRKSK